MRMKWLLCLSLLLACGVCAQSPDVTATAENAPQTVADLRARLDAVIQQPQYVRGLWGVKVASLDTGRVLYEHNSEKLFSPASNCKLYTVALGLHRLGADYCMKTSLYARKAPDAAGVLDGELMVFGRGDPTMKSPSLTINGLAALDPLVEAVVKAGVKTIRGGVVADSSYVRGPEFGAGWSWDDQQYYYGAEISALTLNDNLLLASIKPGDRAGDPCSITLYPEAPFMEVINRTSTGPTNAGRTISFYRVPSRNVLYVSGRLPLEGKVFTDDVTVHEPAAMFGEFFARALERKGVRVEGGVRTIDWLGRQTNAFNSQDFVELGSVQSLPLREIAAKIQKPSQNLYTDLLLAHVGERSRTGATPRERTSEELGIAEMNKFLVEVGIPRDQFYLEEGSGLSRNNLATPAATVALLQFMSKHPAAEAYKAALPVAGVDGTLRSRMKATAATGNVRAKTGSLRWASSLSGYVTTASGEKLVFSFMVNRFHAVEPTKSTRTDLDAMAVLLADFAGKPES